MSFPAFSPKRDNSQNIDWAARLIPGVAARFARNAKKQPRSVRLETGSAAPGLSAIPREARSETTPADAFALLLPNPLKGRSAGYWLRSIAGDFALVGLNWLFVGALALWLRTLVPQIRIFEHLAGAVSLLGVALLHAALITLLGYSERLYSVSGGLPEQVRALGKAVLWATALLCVAYRLQGSPVGMIVAICGAGLMNFGALVTWRWESQKLGRANGHGNNIRNMLIVGAGGFGQRVAAYVESHPEKGRTVCGFLDDDLPLGNGVIGRLSDLPHLARAGFVDEVMLAAPHDQTATLDLLREARRLRLDVEMVPELFGCKPAESEGERVGNLPVIWLHEERLPIAELWLKRAVDIVAAGIALIFLAPLLALLAILIKLDSKGPVIYAAQRAGRKGRPFHCCKFRTMVCNADDLKSNLRAQNQRAGPFFKIAGDPRITRLGYFLRRYSLDELPQLWNVVKGEMSLVGPRPHPLDDFAAYEIEHLARLDVTPGITGLWQVTARRDPSFQKGIELDREYIRTWSLGMDLRILFKTLEAVLRGSGD